MVLEMPRDCDRFNYQGKQDLCTFTFNKNFEKNLLLLFGEDCVSAKQTTLDTQTQRLTFFLFL